MGEIERRKETDPFSIENPAPSFPGNHSFSFWEDDGSNFTRKRHRSISPPSVNKRACSAPHSQPQKPALKRRRNEEDDQCDPCQLKRRRIEHIQEIEQFVGLKRPREEDIIIHRMNKMMCLNNGTRCAPNMKREQKHL